MFEDPKFWLLVSFILFVILMIKPFKSMLIGGLDQKIEEIKWETNVDIDMFEKIIKDNKELFKNSSQCQFLLQLNSCKN